jgi:hypothetical protein
VNLSDSICRRDRFPLRIGWLYEHRGKGQLVKSPVFSSCGKHDRISSVVSKDILPSRSAAEHHEAGIALASECRFAEAIKEYLVISSSCRTKPL